MEFDRSSLDKILSMDEKSFSALVEAIAQGAGASKAKTQAMLSNTDLLKKRLAGMSPAEARGIIDAAGKEKSEEIMNMLRSQGIDIG